MTITLLSLFGAIVAGPFAFFFLGNAIMAHVRRTIDNARAEANKNG